MSEKNAFKEALTLLRVGKSDLETLIMTALQVFEDSTGFTVRDVTIDRRMDHTKEGTTKLCRVHIEVHLD